MTSDGSEGLCTNVLLLKEFPGVRIGAGVGWRGSVQLAQGNNPFVRVLIALRHFFATFILYIC